MTAVARNHHYLPQCYLRGFRRPNGKVGRKASVYVLDIRTGDQFPTAIRNVGAARDFNRIESDDHPPDVLEGVFSQVETQFARVLAGMTKSLTMPTGEDLNVLFNFMALFSVHNPWVRNTINEFQAGIIEHILDLVLADEKRWKAQKRKMEADGIEVSDSVSYEDLKRFHDERRYTLEFPNERNLDLAMSGMNVVLRTLADRKWTLAIGREEVGHFITCDRPVSLRWSKQEGKPPLMPPGHGMPETQVVFPVSPELALLGTFEGESRTIEASAHIVAAFNERIAAFAVRQIWRRFP